MIKSSLFFSVYNIEKIDNDLELEAILDTIKDLCKYLNKPKRTLYNLGIRKNVGIRKQIKIDNKEYMIIVDKE